LPQNHFLSDMSNIVLKTKHMFGYIIKVLKAKNKVFFFFYF